MNAKTWDLFHEVESDDSCLVYMGEFDDHFTDILIEVNQAAANLDDRSTRKKVAFLTAECFQNIIRHGDANASSDAYRKNPKMFSLRNHGGIYYMCTSNIVTSDRVEQLTNTLTSLGNVSDEELKKIYLNSLEHNEHNEAGGAGLGLIEMARKSKQAPDFYFEKQDGSFSNFFMQLEIIPKELQVGVHPTYIPIEKVRSLYKKLCEHNILVLRKGNFSQENVLPLFKLIEANLKWEVDEGSGINKKGIYILLEMLQNLSKYGHSSGERTEGIITISDDGSNIHIHTGNYVQNRNVEKLKLKLAQLSAMDENALKSQYKKALFNFGAEKMADGAGIGFIEMFKISRKPVEFEFVPATDDTSFFSLSITL